MKIENGHVVGLTWTLKDTLGETLDVLEEPVDFLVAGGDLPPAVESALLGHEAGARLDLHLEPEEAFGDYDETKVYLEARTLFPPALEAGMCFEQLPAGVGAPGTPDTLYTVTEVYPEHVVLDANHPLAGIALRLALKVESVRVATEEEASLGSAGTGFFRLR